MEDRNMNLDTVLEREPSPVPHRQRADRDLDLLEALRLHDPGAAERLVTTYGDRAFRLATSITGSEQDAEEVVQDAFWSVVRKIDTFRGESAFGSWLYRIVANAEAWGLSVTAVKSRVHRARLFLRKQLGEVMTTLDATAATPCES